MTSVRCWLCIWTGARHDGADSAVLLRATWRDTRRAVLRAGGVTEFAFRQYLFACQARVLLRLGRPQEVWPSNAPMLFGRIGDHSTDHSTENVDLHSLSSRDGWCFHGSLCTHGHVRLFSRSAARWRSGAWFS